MRQTVLYCDGIVRCCCIHHFCRFIPRFFRQLPMSDVILWYDIHNETKFKPVETTNKYEKTYSTHTLLLTHSRKRIENLIFVCIIVLTCRIFDALLTFFAAPRTLWWTKNEIIHYNGSFFFYSCDFRTHPTHTQTPTHSRFHLTLSFSAVAAFWMEIV